MIISGCVKVVCRLKCAGVTAQSRFGMEILYYSSGDLKKWPPLSPDLNPPMCEGI
jgi:hypothetical protein